MRIRSARNCDVHRHRKGGRAARRYGDSADGHRHPERGRAHAAAAARRDSRADGRRSASRRDAAAASPARAADGPSPFIREEAQHGLSAPFEQLDYIYNPSRDVPAELRYFEDVLRARVVFAVEGMGARVAMIELAPGPPAMLLADHLEGERPVFVYRVPDLDAALTDLESRRWQPDQQLELRMRPCRTVTARC